ncbi:uncharacterized protein EHS24_006452 [Apiotrichum porosum]|uniref:Uncharacterized protein n=1 Tax=Apiotrichum porosum TaxID=105984 RepID=A0A427Y1A9_9TREE|nr:uncharacterized protein EHS24_006452 [Apiotrichum porosum]RSH84908.1 hypothetical protein EHS24_006452 [Apiotrichum porosum]
MTDRQIDQGHDPITPCNLVNHAHQRFGVTSPRQPNDAFTSAQNLVRLTFAARRERKDLLDVPGDGLPFMEMFKAVRDSYHKSFTDMGPSPTRESLTTAPRRLQRAWILKNCFESFRWSPDQTNHVGPDPMSYHSIGNTAETSAHINQFKGGKPNALVVLQAISLRLCHHPTAAVDDEVFDLITGLMNGAAALTIAWGYPHRDLLTSGMRAKVVAIQGRLERFLGLVDELDGEEFDLREFIVPLPLPSITDVLVGYSSEWTSGERRYETKKLLDEWKEWMPEIDEVERRAPRVNRLNSASSPERRGMPVLIGSHLHALLGSHPPWTHQRTFYCSGHVRTNAAGDVLCVGRDRESGLAHCHAGIGYHPLNTLFGRDCHTRPGRAQPLACNARIQLWAVNQFRGSYRCQALVRQLWNATNKILFERVLSTLCRRGVIAGPIKLAPLYKPSPQLLAMWQTNGDNDIESALRYPTFAAEVKQQLRAARQAPESFEEAKRSFYEDLGLSGGCVACGEDGTMRISAGPAAAPTSVSCAGSKLIPLPAISFPPASPQSPRSPASPRPSSFHHRQPPPPSTPGSSSLVLVTSVAPRLCASATSRAAVSAAASVGRKNATTLDARQIHDGNVRTWADMEMNMVLILDRSAKDATAGSSATATPAPSLQLAPHQAARAE